MISRELKKEIYVKVYNFICDDLRRAEINPDELDFEMKDDINHLRLSGKSEKYYSETSPIKIVTVSFSNSLMPYEKQKWLDEYGSTRYLLNEDTDERSVLRSPVMTYQELLDLLEQSYDEVHEGDQNSEY